ncbi:chemotaxis protein CheB [Pedobacter sp. P351]|uniref:chemotaxis protein CheB n=1 Tax=Pedobacter superstes TaxID=3133441 RepID=UPI0030A18C02
MPEITKIVVVGASAGGLKAVAELISKFPKNNNISVFIVLHVSKNSIGPVIVTHIQKHTSLICEIPSNGDLIKPGHIYIAPPDHHMIIKRDEICIHNGARENRWRPSIDVLFRSAAVAYGSKVIGIVLTGLMDDGTSGMGAIKRSGGVCIVQEPEEAEFSDMPANVLNNVDVNYRVSISEMGYILEDLFSKPSGPEIRVPRELEIEAEITEKLSSKIQDLEKIGEQTLFSCPECGGGLWKIKGDTVVRYRCHTGHVYTLQTLLQAQAEGIEKAIWVAIRMLEERRNLLLISSAYNSNSPDDSAEDIKSRTEDVNNHIERLKTVLQFMRVNEPNA